MNPVPLFPGRHHERKRAMHGRGFVAFFIGSVIAVVAQHASATRIMAPHCLAMDTRLNLPIAELSRDVQTGSGLDARCAAQAILDWHAGKAIPLLTKLFRSGTIETRLEIVKALGSDPLPPRRKAVQPLLLRALHDSDAEVRGAAFYSLEFLQAYPHEALLAALHALHHGKDVEFLAIEYLKEAPALPRWMAAPLLEALEKTPADDGGTQTDVRIRLLHALARTRDPKALAVVADAALSCGGFCTVDAYEALVGSGEAGVAPLERIFPKANANARIDILLALKQIDTPRSRAAVARRQPDIVRAAYRQLDSVSVFEQSNGLVALGRMQTLAQPAFARIVPFLDSPEPQLRAEAAAALGEIGLAEAIPPLRMHLHDPNNWVRSQIGIALAELDWSTRAKL